MRGFQLAALVWAAVLLGACGGSGSAPRLVSAEEAARSADLQVCPGAPGSATDAAHEPETWRGSGNDTWRTADGCIVRIDAVTSFTGAAFCGRESIRFLHAGKPVGSLIRDIEGGAMYVRDPERTYERALTPALDLDAELPAGATDTGFRQGDAELWIVPGDASAVYLRSGAAIERWPRDPAFSACE